MGSTQDLWQGRVTWHATSPQCHYVCARGVVALGCDSSGISRQSCPGTSPATAARSTVTGRRRKPTSHLGRRLIRLPWVSTQQLPKYIHKYIHTHTPYCIPPPRLPQRCCTRSSRRARLRGSPFLTSRRTGGTADPSKRVRGCGGKALVPPDLGVIWCPVPLQMSSGLGSPRGVSQTPLEASPSTSDLIRTSHR